MICPICHQENGPLISHFHAERDAPIVQALQEFDPHWQPDQGVCRRCIDQAQLAPLAAVPTSYELETIGDYWILPIPERLHAHPAYHGRGVTICFIDSGFQLHPDLRATRNRILKTVDIHRPSQATHPEWAKPHPHAWHGTMTSVVGAGDGHQSGGRYRSLAPEADVVLIKVMDENGRITGNAIEKALLWVLAHHTTYGIRIVNLSITDDDALPYRQNAVNLAVEQLVAAGINVVAAAGNTAGATVKAPANSPHAITVGGLNDANTLHPLNDSLYHSTFGPTADFTYKPELIAPAIWLPAPILLDSSAQREAEALFRIKATTPRYQAAVAANLWHRISLQPSLLRRPSEELESIVDTYLDGTKYLSGFYQHSDGTSFAAPIVCSVIAQLLEANPTLDAAEVREILLNTAHPLPGFPEERQGFGVIHPLNAVNEAKEDHHDLPVYFNPLIDYRRRRVQFRVHEAHAQRVELAGAFNNWQATPFTPDAEQHFWQGQIPLPPPGRYPYKLVINGTKWLPDQRNLFREPDDFGGFHSLLIVEAQ